MISASRSGLRFSPAKRFLISIFHSGMLHPRNPAHSFGELLPLLALQREDALPLRSQAVVPPSPLTRLFHPSPLDPAPLLKPIKQRIEGGHVKMERAARADFNELADFVSVTRLVLQQGKNQALRASFFPFLLCSESHIWASHMSYAGKAMKISGGASFSIFLVR